MTDDVVCFYGGPKDGEVVLLPPDMVPLPVDSLGDLRGVPHRIEFKAGGAYVLSVERRRYEWAL